MRHLEPFSYFANHASAIEGFGGVEPAPDPRYFFHTHYEPVQPGRAVFRLAIEGARASRGELTLRVHAYKPGASGEIGLAGGGRIVFDEARPDAATVRLPVRFLAAPDTHYALYGFFSDPTDLVADAIEISIEELPSPAKPGGAPGETLGSERPAAGFGETAKLCIDKVPSLLHPISQACTPDQIAGESFDALWPDIPAPQGDAVTRWTMVMPLQALAGAGMLGAGRRGLLLNAPHPALAETLRAAGCTVTEEASGAAGPYDFVVGYQEETPVAPARAYAALQDQLLAEVAGGGLTIAVLAVPSGEAPSAIRNAIQQVALRLIGGGHDVAQLNFARPFARAGTGPEGGRFGLIARV